MTIKERNRHSNKPKVQFRIFELIEKHEADGKPGIRKTELMQKLLDEGFKKGTIESNLTELVAVGCLTRAKQGWYSMSVEPSNECVASDLGITNGLEIAS